VLDPDRAIPSPDRLFGTRQKRNHALFYGIRTPRPAAAALHGRFRAFIDDDHVIAHRGDVHFLVRIVIPP
jgi:hypothetical protein